MNPHPPASPTATNSSGHKRIRKRGVQALASLLVGYTGLAYFLLPTWWRVHERGVIWPEIPKITRTANGIPGDPVNVALIGTHEEVIHALVTAHWLPADPITMKTSLRIGESCLLGLPYPEAPVSNLYLWGRPQGLAFQQAVGKSARRRHHVRFWKSDVEVDGRPLWLGAVTFDSRVGLSHTTGQITHHISPDVDKERDKLMTDLGRAGTLADYYKVPGVGATSTGHNGGGDLYATDGDMTVGVLKTKTDSVAAK